jgi:hypothetical protein
MRKEWNEKEERYLLRKYLCQPVELTAERLGRSIPSVKHKAQKMGLNCYTDYMGARTVARCFQCDISVVKRWIHKFGLPAKEIPYGDGVRYDIDTLDFLEWAEYHKDIINWSRYIFDSMPPEPQWVRQEKLNYKAVNTNKRITRYDEQQIRGLLRYDKSYKEIATEVGRTTESIRHIMRTKRVI